MPYTNGRRWGMGPDREWDISTVKKYGDRYKLTHHKTSVLTPGLDRPGRDPPTGPGPSDEERFASSLSRTRNAVYELAACNPWEWFCTWTLSPDSGFDRYDTAWYKDFAQWMRNQRRLTGTRIAYLCVPESHKDGGVHLHALMNDLPADRLHRLTTEEYLPYRLLDKLKGGEQVYTWPAYQRKYGWCTLEPIKDRDRCASYIAKYVTKAMGGNAAGGGIGADKKVSGGGLSLAKGAKMYYASHGLQRAELLYRGRLGLPPEMIWDWHNDYIEIRWFDELPDELKKEVTG